MKVITIALVSFIYSFIIVKYLHSILIMIKFVEEKEGAKKCLLLLESMKDQSNLDLVSL